MLCTGGNLLVPGAPCAFVQEAAAGNMGVGCQQAELGTAAPRALHWGCVGQPVAHRKMLQGT